MYFALYEANLFESLHCFPDFLLWIGCLTLLKSRLIGNIFLFLEKKYLRQLKKSTYQKLRRWKLHIAVDWKILYRLIFIQENHIFDHSQFFRYCQGNQAEIFLWYFCKENVLEIFMNSYRGHPSVLTANGNS